MSDFIGGIKPAQPSYPISPVQKSNKDTDAGKRRQQQEKPHTEKQDDDDQPPHIDELV